MNSAQVMKLLKANQNEEGIKKWNQEDSPTNTLKSFGIGLTVLRKLAKQIGKDHTLALELWNTDVYDARIIAMLIDDPKQMTREEAEVQVENLTGGHLAHVFSSCGASLAKTPFVAELASDWMDSQDTTRRCCGYGLLYEMSKSKKKSGPDESFYMERIAYINRNFSSENRAVQGSMAGSLMGMGKRSARLNAAALKVARKIGPVQFGSDESNCEPFDVVKHLTSDYIKKKLGV